MAGPLIPASAPTGGGHIVTTITVPVGPNEDKLVTVTATAEDLVGNVSAPSDAVSKRIDRKPPKKIQ